MFDSIVGNNDAGIEDKFVALKGQIQISERFIGDTAALREAKSAVLKYGRPDYSLSKTALLEIWKDGDVSFVAKCLATIWWGRPDHRVSSRVYSVSNLGILSRRQIEEEFNSLSEEKDASVFKARLELLYSRFLRGGDFHLNGVGVSFFTKFFYFFFASHPPKSIPDYLPVIADDVMRSAVFAEMIDRGEDVNSVFYTRDASLRSYIGYVDKFNTIAEDCQVSSFVLEDIVFNRSRGIGNVYVAAYNGRDVSFRRAYCQIVG